MKNRTCRVISRLKPCRTVDEFHITEAHRQEYLESAANALIVIDYEYSAYGYVYPL